MFERKNAVTPFGITIKTKLLELNRTQNWLIEQVKAMDTSVYVDSSVINKVLTGQIKTGKVVDAIKRVLNIEENGGELNAKPGSGTAVLHQK